jgi:ParB family chromosome partitioning protein
MTRPRQTITVLPIRQLTSHPANIRDDLGDLDDMAKSIREHGIVQPLTVTEHPTLADTYVVIDGHRRLAGALKAHETKVPVMIRHGLADETEHTVLMLITGLHRLELNPVERARGYGRLQDAGLNMSEIARRTGVKPSVVSYYLNLLHLDDDTLERVEEGTVPVGAAIAAVREQRQAERVESGGALRGRPTFVRAWFGRSHRLAERVRERCTHRKLTQIGEAGCGPCWEQEIAEEYTEDYAAAAAAAVAAAAARQVELEGEIDHILVERIVNGEWSLAKSTSVAEKHAIADLWFARGGSIAQLSKHTGWKGGRYGQPRTQQVAS